MRARPKKVIKTIFITSFFCFIIINLNLFLRTEPQNDENADSIEAMKSRKPSSINTTLNTTTPPPHIEKPSVLNLTWHSSLPLSELSSRLLLPSIANYSNEQIIELVRAANRNQRILNLERFELAASGESTVVVVVQVHNRYQYLVHLIDSLRRAQSIEQILLIFSHDFLDDKINQLIASIDFCPVMQIFYPFLIQLHPNEFPGESPADCPRNTNKADAMKIKCANAEYPDKYGHYREAKYAQTKHHWFWKLNHVFDHLDVTSSFNGPFLFIEEDHYLVEDFIPVLRKMYRLREKGCSDCNIFTLATYDKHPAYGPMSSRVDVTNWISSKHNMGMSFNRETWTKIKTCAKQFCDFDDYNWDWSMHYIGMGCIPNKLKVMVCKSPRVYHIGECGVHHKGKSCDSVATVNQIEKLLDNNKRWLYPDTLLVGGYPKAPTRLPKPNGGWGDLRDHELCLSFLQEHTHR